MRLMINGKKNASAFIFRITVKTTENPVSLNHIQPTIP
jgi:hypothetical protein